MKRYKPRYTLGELRNMEMCSGDCPGYLMIPNSQTMVSIFEKLALLNNTIKSKDCTIRKTPFYNLKERTIIYFLEVCKGGHKSDWSYKFDGLQESPNVLIHEEPQILAMIELLVGGASFKFCMPVRDSLMRVLFNEIYQAEIHSHIANDCNYSKLDPINTIQTWERLLSIYEDNNWFIYEQAHIHQWINYIKVWYPHLKLRVAGDLKLSTILGSGPMVQVNGSDLCRFYELKHNFSKIFEERGMAHEFSLTTKKN